MTYVKEYIYGIVLASILCLLMGIGFIIYSVVNFDTETPIIIAGDIPVFENYINRSTEQDINDERAAVASDILKKTILREFPKEAFVMHDWILTHAPVINEYEMMNYYERHEFLCLALNIYHEARGSTPNDQMSVAQVTLNRTNHSAWPDNICAVVWQVTNRLGEHVAQFSWTLDGKRDRPTGYKDWKAWKAAQQYALLVYTGKVKDITGAATHYHATYVRPGWSCQNKKNIKCKLIGAHLYMNLKIPDTYASLR